MELSQLQYLVALSEEQNFTRAAARCHVTQQALSAAVARLERSVGTALVERTTRTVRLTEAGRAFVQRAGRALTEADAAVADARAAALGYSGRIRLGFHGPGADLAAPLLRSFDRTHPGIQVTLHRYDFTDPSAGVLSSQADLGLVAAPLRHPDLRATPILDEPMIVVVGSGHHLATRHADGSPVTVDELTDEHLGEMTNEANDPLVAQWNAFWCLRHLPSPPPLAPAAFTGVEEWLALQRNATWVTTGPTSAARLYPASGVQWLTTEGLPVCRWRLLSPQRPAPAAQQLLHHVASMSDPRSNARPAASRP